MLAMTECAVNIILMLNKINLKHDAAIVWNSAQSYSIAVSQEIQIL